MNKSRQTLFIAHSRWNMLMPPHGGSLALIIFKLERVCNDNKIFKRSQASLAICLFLWQHPSAFLSSQWFKSQSFFFISRPFFCCWDLYECVVVLVDNGSWMASERRKGNERVVLSNWIRGPLFCALLVENMYKKNIWQLALLRVGRSRRFCWVVVHVTLSRSK